MNPTFAPLPPLADEIKTRIYNAYYHNITDSSATSDAQVIRGVSAKFGVAMDRVRAIVRLKELEQSWKTEVSPSRLSTTNHTHSLRQTTCPRSITDSHDVVTQKRTLQTNLLKGMESHLGVKQPTEKWKGVEDPDRPLEQRSTGKTVFEMVDVESVSSPFPSLSSRPTPY